MTVLCPADQLVAGRATLVRRSQTESVILVRLADGGVVAWRNACPHMGIELDWDAARLLTRDGRFLRCTGHDAWFQAATGVCVRGPCRGEVLTPVAVQIVDDQVRLAV